MEDIDHSDPIIELCMNASSSCERQREKQDEIQQSSYLDDLTRATDQENTQPDLNQPYFKGTDVLTPFRRRERKSVQTSSRHDIKKKKTEKKKTRSTSKLKKKTFYFQPRTRPFHPENFDHIELQDLLEDHDLSQLQASLGDLIYSDITATIDSPVVHPEDVRFYRFFQLAQLSAESLLQSQATLLAETQTLEATCHADQVSIEEAQAEIKSQERELHELQRIRDERRAKIKTFEMMMLLPSESTAPEEEERAESVDVTISRKETGRLWTMTKSRTSTVGMILTDLETTTEGRAVRLYHRSKSNTDELLDVPDRELESFLSPGENKLAFSMEYIKVEKVKPIIPDDLKVQEQLQTLEDSFKNETRELLEQIKSQKQAMDELQKTHDQLLQQHLDQSQALAEKQSQSCVGNDVLDDEEDGVSFPPTKTILKDTPDTTTQVIESLFKEERRRLKKKTKKLKKKLRQFTHPGPGASSSTSTCDQMIHEDLLKYQSIDYGFWNSNRAEVPVQGIDQNEALELVKVEDNVSDSNTISNPDSALVQGIDQNEALELVKGEDNVNDSNTISNPDSALVQGIDQNEALELVKVEDNVSDSNTISNPDSALVQEIDQNEALELVKGEDNVNDSNTISNPDSALVQEIDQNESLELVEVEDNVNDSNTISNPDSAPVQGIDQNEPLELVEVEDNVIDSKNNDLLLEEENVNLRDVVKSEQVAQCTLDEGTKEKQDLNPVEKDSSRDQILDEGPELPQLEPERLDDQTPDEPCPSIERPNVNPTTPVGITRFQALYRGFVVRQHLQNPKEEKSWELSTSAGKCNIVMTKHSNLTVSQVQRAIVSQLQLQSVSQVRVLHRDTGEEIFGSKRMFHTEFEHLDFEIIATKSTESLEADAHHDETHHDKMIQEFQYRDKQAKSVASAASALASTQVVFNEQADEAATVIQALVRRSLAQNKVEHLRLDALVTRRLSSFDQQIHIHERANVGKEPAYARKDLLEAMDRIRAQLQTSKSLASSKSCLGLSTHELEIKLRTLRETQRRDLSPDVQEKIKSLNVTLSALAKKNSQRTSAFQELVDNLSSDDSDEPSDEE